MLRGWVFCCWLFGSLVYTNQQNRVIARKHYLENHSAFMISFRVRSMPRDAKSGIASQSEVRRGVSNQNCMTRGARMHSAVVPSESSGVPRPESLPSPDQHMLLTLKVDSPSRDDARIMQPLRRADRAPPSPPPSLWRIADANPRMRGNPHSLPPGPPWPPGSLPGSPWLPL